MFPGYVFDLDDAVVAFERWLDELGGLPSEVVVETLEDGFGEVITLRFNQLTVRFPAAKTVLDVALDVDASLTPTFYKFDFRHQDGELIHRWDMHQGHEEEHGGPWHIHDGCEENRRPADPVDLRRIGERVVEFNAAR